MGYRVAGASRRQGRAFLAVALAGFVVASVSLVGPTVAPSPAQAAPVVSAPMTTYANIRMITGISSPRAVAVDSTDDTVYVGSGSDSRIFIVNGRTGTLDDFVDFGNGEVKGIAVDDVDDSIYATISDPSGLALISGTNPHDDSTVTAATDIGGVAVNTEDDSVYVAGTVFNNVRKFSGKTGSLLGNISTAPNGRYPSGVAVDSLDDSIYSGNDIDNNVSIIDGGASSVSSTVGVLSIVNTYLMMATNQADDTVYALNGGNDVVSVIDGKTGVLTDDTIDVGAYPYAVAVDQADDTVYVTNRSSDSLSVINGRTATLTDDTIDFGSSAGVAGVAVDEVGTNGGLVYVAAEYLNSLAVIARVTPTIWPPSAPAGNTVTLTLDVPQAAYDVDSATVTTVYFDNTVATKVAGPGDTWTVTVPPGSGTVPVTVKLRGGLYASAGTFTFGTVPSAPVLNSATGGPGSIDIAWTEIYDGGFPIRTVYYAINGFLRRDLGTLVSPATITADSNGNPLADGTTYTVRIQLENSAGERSSWSNDLSATTTSPAPPTPPTPPVTYPPGPPTNAAAVAGDADAAVSWSAPADSGSFSITDYEVKASPGGASCLVKVPDTKCTVTGLSNGTAYTFEVRALNGAGWGAWSAPSDPVTPVGPQPTPTIVITGSRGAGADAGRVFADGVTTHLAGEQVQARVHLSRQVNYENGSVRTVASNGTFGWQRKTNKTVYIYFRAVDQRDVRSNRIVIRPN